MTMKALLAGVLAAMLVTSSCFFQNDPLIPNQPPVILSCAPDVTFFTLAVPDSCTFALEASDPDGDQIQHLWFIGDSLISSRTTATFRAVEGGEYIVRGEVRDATRRAMREWFVTVQSTDNDPPRIESYYPEQEQIACLVGDTVDFHLTASDDNPSTLRYIYRLDGTELQTGPPDLSHRFMERGEYIIEGIAWDGSYGDTIAWNLAVEGDPDTIAPGAIVDLVGGPGDLDGELLLEWTAPGDDGYVGRAASYVVKTSVYPILTESDWLGAEGKVGEPVPSIAGTSERMIIRNLVSASCVYVAARAFDDFMNLSPLGNCVKASVRGIDIGGRIRDARTGAGLPGIIVSASTLSAASGADGSYLLANVPSYTKSISARDEFVSEAPGAYYDVVKAMPSIEQYVSVDFEMIGVFGLVSTIEPDVYYLGRFLSFYREITNTAGDYGMPTVYRGWNHWPITVYNPAFAWQGVDLRSAASTAMDDWETPAFADLFVATDSPDEADVVIVYDTISYFHHHVATLEYNPDGTPKRKELRIYTQYSEVPIRIYAQLVFAHEFGHVIGFVHSRNIGHLMMGLMMPIEESPTVDEINAVRCLYHFPNIFDYSCVIDE